MQRHQSSIDTFQAEIPFTMEIKEDGAIHAKLGEDLPTLLSQVRFDEEKGILSGALMGTIDTEDVLGGEAQALSLAGNLGSRLTHWLELKKE